MRGKVGATASSILYESTMPILIILLDKRLNSGITIARELEYFQSRTVDENSVTFLLNNIPDAPFEAKDARQIQIQAASRYQTYILTTYILEAARREYNKKTGETPPVNLIHATQPERYAVYRDLWSADRENTCRDMWRPVAKSIYWEAIFHPDPKSKACDLQVMKACRNYLKACLIFAMDSAITKRLLVRSGRDADFQGAETYAFNEWKTLHPQKGFPQPPSVLKIPVPPGKGFAKRRRLAEKPGDNEMEGVISDED